jgi:hypothetical protein
MAGGIAAVGSSSSLIDDRLPGDRGRDATGRIGGAIDERVPHGALDGAEDGRCSESAPVLAGYVHVRLLRRQIGARRNG